MRKDITREEAIQELKEIRFNTNARVNGTGKFDAALSYAIEQLEMAQDSADTVREKLLQRGDEMVSFRDLVERFDDADQEFKGSLWNLRQIYNNFNILAGTKPCSDCVSREAVIRKLPAHRYRDINAYREVQSDIEKLPPVYPKSEGEQKE